MPALYHPSMDDATPPHPSALAGVRVLDLSRVLAGPWATQILGDFGAEVIKVERPGAGDDTRSWGPPFAACKQGRADAAYFLAANRNKKSVAIDFAKPEGAELVRALAKQCHIVVENFKTGGLAAYGLDYESIAAINPAIVYCSITGFGQYGPYADRAGYDFAIQGMGGLMSLSGEPQGQPIKSAAPVADLFTGMYALVAILAALRHAERTGQGQHIDAALLDCQIAMLANLGANYLLTGDAPQRFGNEHASIVPYAVFPTADGHIILAVGNDSQFRDFCAVARSALAADPRFVRNADRVRNRAALTEALSALMATRTTADWLAALGAARVPCGPVNSLPEVFADPHVTARRLVQTYERSDGTKVQLVRNPLQLTETSPHAAGAPPLLGQDTDAVLAERLGMDEGQCARLRDMGVIA
jgi:crotonobetainyl-CoA:carnitine CoA-transferase CaiB-like acyl-CoA transferase